MGRRNVSGPPGRDDSMGGPVRPRPNEYSRMYARAEPIKARIGVDSAAYWSYGIVPTCRLLSLLGETRPA